MSYTSTSALKMALFGLLGFVMMNQQVASFSILPDTNGMRTLGISSRHHGDDRRMNEFINLEPLLETEVRRKRLEKDDENKAQFVEFGDKLWDLRNKLDKLSHRLLAAITDGKEMTEERTREMLRRVERQDPELVYTLELMELEQAAQEGRLDDAAEHRRKALAARSCLPQFNLEGLWIGKYGSNGYEMVNVTYVGDTLIAYKVTGDKNVPRTQVTFQTNLHPLRYNMPDTQEHKALQPITLTEKAAVKWGTRQLPRYGGLGRVAEEGFRNDQWMDGQLIIIGDQYFSFAWIPIEQQIFFGRPSPELALKMLRDSGISGLRTARQTFEAPPSIEDDVDLQKEFATRCLEKTDEFHDEWDGDAFGCIWSSTTAEECVFE
jgi:hypothetical protein